MESVNEILPPAVRPIKGRNLDHLWKKGQSGNPKGRPVGVKNKLTIAKLILESELREQLKFHAADIMKMAIGLAKNGDTSMIKLLIDKMVPTSKASEDEAPKEKVQIVIGRLPDGRNEPTVINGEVIKDE